MSGADTWSCPIIDAGPAMTLDNMHTKAPILGGCDAVPRVIQRSACSSNESDLAGRIVLTDSPVQRALVAFSHSMNRGIILPVFVDLLLIVEWRTEGVPMTKETKIKEQKKTEEDANLDEALAETFPRSDPPSMIQPRTRAIVMEIPAGRQSKGEVSRRTNHK